jgi:hypothetical protein
MIPVDREASLAQVDPGTGLQFDEGPSRNRYIQGLQRKALGRLGRWTKAVVFLASRAAATLRERNCSWRGIRTVLTLSYLK